MVYIYGVCGMGGTNLFDLVSLLYTTGLFSRAIWVITSAGPLLNKPLLSLVSFKQHQSLDMLGVREHIKGEHLQVMMKHINTSTHDQHSGNT
jgi:hypothetical protein